LAQIIVRCIVKRVTSRVSLMLAINVSNKALSWTQVTSHRTY